MTLTKPPLKKEQVALDIKAYIDENEMVHGDRLLSEKKLAAHFRVNHLTIRSALSILEEQGVVERRPGSGTYVNGGVAGQVEADHDLVAMVVHSSGHLHEDLVDLIYRRLYAIGKMAVVFPTDTPDFEERIVGELLRLREKGCDRLIINQAAFKSELFLKIMEHPDLRFSQVVRIMGNKPDPRGLQGRRVTIDYGEAFRLLVEHLKNLGHKRIALMVGGMGYDAFGQSNKRNVELYTQAMIDAGLAEMIRVCIYTTESDADEKLREVLKESNRPTAIIGDIDWRGVKAIENGEKVGLKVPEDLSVVGFGDTPWARSYDLTTVRYDLNVFAELIVESLMESVSGPVRMVAPELVVRNTTKAIQED